MLEDKCRNYSWYINSNNGNIYQISLIIDNLDIFSNDRKDNTRVLRKLDTKKYTHYKVNLDKIKGSKEKLLNAQEG